LGTWMPSRARVIMGCRGPSVGTDCVDGGAGSPSAGGDGGAGSPGTDVDDELVVAFAGGADGVAAGDVLGAG
jgi:hypothetical protein